MSGATPTSSKALAVRPRRFRGRPLLLAAAIFMGGGVCGAALATFLIFHVIHHGFEHPDMVSDHVAARLKGFLDLDEAQARQVRQIIARRQDALADIRRDIQPQVDAELSSLESEIDAVLTDDQRVKWREHVKQFREHWLPPTPAAAAPENEGSRRRSGPE